MPRPVLTGGRIPPKAIASVCAWCREPMTERDRRLIERVDRLVDAGLDPRPLVVMLYERIEERSAAGRGIRDPWERLCSRESRCQYEADSTQYRIRSASTLEEREEALREFLPRARRHVVSLVRMIGQASAELREVSR
jgi:hypothetical protein